MNGKRAVEEFKKEFGKRYSPYLQSVREVNHDFLFMVRGEKRKYLIIMGGSLPGEFKGSVIGRKKEGNTQLSIKLCELSHETIEKLRQIFPWLSPSPLGLKASFGTGDRLGLATPGHIRALRDRRVLAVLAQQSIREISRTKRTLGEVMDSALWGCFQDGYEGPFGADADHIKEMDDLKEAVAIGYSMFTIDPSDFVRADLNARGKTEIDQIYQSMEGMDKLERLYLKRKYGIKGNKLHYEKDPLKNITVPYLPAIRFAIECYEYLRDYMKGGFDFEVSVDETPFPTNPLAHIFIAEELHRSQVDFQNLALRFVGNFQKGIDYIGNLDEFERELDLHAAIARNFGGYKLSLHSGSDKFSVYPIFKEKTRGLFHVKTAGTSWLEAVRVIARKDPFLYRRLHEFALRSFEKDRSSYQVTTDISRIPDLTTIPGKKLETLMDREDSRQLLHLTYGSLLSTRDEEGNFLYRDEIYRDLFQYEEEHYRAVSSHIDKHLQLLGL
ncbi:hypothetical protein E3J48_06410 [Candidatus Aerophobetes bacterium]|uniref:Tagaturonate/fructuronate epimerase n=1 Tax=Aerophobetes bacterium TaxID=2030807 RepID=A0A523W0W3_UNCAE|nr:MAG: hypothetical protein E3J48_06410 [Candidatus Aerophobetes bacterium]